MSSSPQNYTPADSGSTTGALTPGQQQIPTRPTPQYQGFAGQGFNENVDVYPSFLPGKAGASATGETPEILNAILGISPGGAGHVARGTDAHGGDAQPAASTTTPLTLQEQAELASLQREMAEVNNAEGPGSAARLRQFAGSGASARMAELMKKSMTPEQMQIAALQQRLDQISGGGGYNVNAWGSSHGGGGSGGNYGGSNHGGGHASDSAGMGGLSKGGLY